MFEVHDTVRMSVVSTAETSSILLTNERLHSGNFTQVLKQLMDGVIMFWSNGVLMVQQQLSGQKHPIIVLFRHSHLRKLISNGGGSQCGC